MQTHWEALAAVAVTKESCVAIDAVQDRVAELEAALKALLWDCPRGIECNDMHHAKPDWHNGDQPCKPLDRYRQAIDNAEAIFNK